jgi:hypothetical protein
VNVLDKNKNKVFFARRLVGRLKVASLQSNNVPFAIGIQTEWQKEMML